MCRDAPVGKVDDRTLAGDSGQLRGQTQRSTQPLPDQPQALFRNGPMAMAQEEDEIQFFLRYSF